MLYVTIKECLFVPGQIVATPGSLAKLFSSEIHAALARHFQGDWGDLDEDDIASNNRALTQGSLILSAYHSSTGQKFWIITEANRACTTLLLPEEY